MVEGFPASLLASEPMALYLLLAIGTLTQQEDE